MPPSARPGFYAFRISGELFTPAGLVYRDGIALTHFEGDHTLTQWDYVLANGVPTAGHIDANGFHTDETGTYTVHENCTGEAEIDFPTPPPVERVPANIHSDATRVSH